MWRMVWYSSVMPLAPTLLAALTPPEHELYLIDMFGVAGHQGSVDYAEDKFEQNHEVGEVPYNCLWAVRGVLVDGDDPRTDMVEESYMRWFSYPHLYYSQYLS